METFDAWWLCGITFQDGHSDPWRNDNIHEGAKVLPQLVLYYGRFRKASSEEHVLDVCNTINTAENGTLSFNLQQELNCIKQCRPKIINDILF